jgi:hypothetical protein
MCPSRASLNPNFRNDSITNITKIIENEEFICRSKVGLPGVLTRKRKLPFKDLVVFISRGVKSSLQRDLDSFYKEVNGRDFNIRHVTKGAFTQARSKLNPEAFVELNDNVNNTFYSGAPYHVWKDMRVLAGDGSRLVLPNHDSVKKEFGEHRFGPLADSKRSLALVSFLYDVLNLVVIDAQIAPYASSERDLLYKHLKKINPGDLLLLDRGYPSLALLFLLNAMGIEFCIRMKEDWWLKVKEFKESGEKSRLINFSLPKKDRTLLKEYPEVINKQLCCRLVCVDLGNDEKEILCTSLTNTEEFPVEDFGDLYHFRWGEEEGFKLFKARVEIEKFSGKTALAVKQDFYATVFIMSLCAVLAFPIEEKVRQESLESNNKHMKKINRTSAIALLTQLSIGLFIKKRVRKALGTFDSIVGKTTEIIRPGRKCNRIKRPKKLYHMNYKPL